MSHPPSIGPVHDKFFAQVASSVVKPQALSNLKLSPVAAPLTKDEQIKALRVAIDALLTHGLRSDIVEQARHVMEVTA